MNRTIRVMAEGDGEIGRVTWNGEDVSVEGSENVQDNLKSGVVGQNGKIVLPSDGEAFLDGVLAQMRGSYVWAEEV